LSSAEQKIRVLPENLINKIAAGEVIDRPASVVKELIENSIDAGATRITVIIKGGGKSLIQIIDNGIGMDEENAIMSFQRHATSKISSFQDMEKITSLGFRGEALASIASVSRIEMKTVPAGEISGTSILLEGGVIQKVDKTGGNPGTSIAVRNIFYNTPARRKFLRADSTEYRYILNILNRFTLAFPEIGFTLINEDNKVFDLKPTTSEERIAEVLGARVRDKLIAVDDDTAVAKISGFIGGFDTMRKSRNDQYLFLNKRYIVDRTINYAIAAGFGDAIPKGLYPLYVIFLEIAPERVDVNVHPTKTEVKFADQHMLFSIVRGAIKRALTRDDVIPSISTRPTLDDIRGRFQMSLQKEIGTPSPQEQIGLDFGRPQIPSMPSQQDTSSVTGSPRDFSRPASDQSTPQTGEHKEAAAVWQLHNKYILSQIKSGLVVIDQHVAHERILYEKAKKSFSEKPASSQQLLFPQTVELTPEDFEILLEMLPFLQKIGFVIKSFGGRTVVIEGVPAGVRVGGENKILMDIIDEYKNNLNAEVDIRERVAKSYACRSAIMAGEKLTPDAMNALIDQLFTTENPYFCPHGRPVMITISIDELDKRFERK